MENKIIFVAFFFFCSLIGKAQNVNLYDSVCVRNFIECSSIKTEVNFVQKNLKAFVQVLGFSDLILLDIARRTKTVIEINAINGNMKVSDEILSKELNEQMEKIKLKQLSDNPSVQ
jgi:hypothetical protein